jgi:hypothetical protein
MTGTPRNFRQALGRELNRHLPPGHGSDRGQAHRVYGCTSTPPLRGRGAPVVPGNVSGRPRKLRIAR